MDLNTEKIFSQKGVEERVKGWKTLVFIETLIYSTTLSKLHLIQLELS